MAKKGGDSLSNGDLNKAIGLYAPSVQELMVIDDLLYTMAGLDGKYICLKKRRSKETTTSFQIDASMDLSLQELVKRVLPLCENYLIVCQFTESRSYFKHGLVNHALAAAIRAILQDYIAMVAQLEHQFRLSRLSLQGLWFFCQAAAMAGDSAARSLLQKLTQSASEPYLGILGRWITDGVIDDPYGEFFIDENKALQKGSLSLDYNSSYWQQRYSIKQDLPEFLASSAETILTTGKYLNVLRECGHTVHVPFPEDVRLGQTDTRQYLVCINVAYKFASAELLNLIINKFDLMGRLRSVKHYFLADQGDFLVHFMDIAKDELVKRPSAISVEKLQPLLDLALRTSVASSDQYHEDLMCNVEKSSLIKQIADMKDISCSFSDLNLRMEKSGDLEGNDTPIQSGAGYITGLETFNLDYKVEWPLSLVLSRKSLTKYQFIFRLLFHCKHVERQLCSTWQVHQTTRSMAFIRTSIPLSYVLCQRMLHFVQSFVHYLTFEVLEPNWHVMYNKLLTAKSIDEVMQQHDMFLDKCLKECVLLWPQIFKKVEKLKSMCLQYATATQWLIPSMSTPDPETQDSINSENNDLMRRGSQGYRSRRNRQLKFWKTSEDSTFKTTLGKIEEEYTKELKKLITLLRSSSQTEPYLAHLAHGLLGVGQEF